MEPTIGTSGEEPAERTPSRRSKLLRVGRRVLGLAVFGYVLWGVLLFSLQRRIIFPRHAVTTVADPETTWPSLERIWIDSPEGRVESWFLAGDGVSAEEPGPAVIFAHGNGEAIDHWPTALAPYRRMGVSVHLPEYRGYGRSAGDPTEEKIARDFARFREELVDRPEVDPGRIVYHGRSLGGGAVCRLAREHPPDALILQSTFTSVRAMASRYLLPGFLVSDPFESLEVVSAYEGPVLVTHGRHDRVVPPEHGRALAEAAPSAELVLYDCGHNDFPVGPAFFGDVRTFLREAGILEDEASGE